MPDSFYEKGSELRKEAEKCNDPDVKKVMLEAIDRYYKADIELVLVKEGHERSVQIMASVEDNPKLTPPDDPASQSSAFYQFLEQALTLGTKGIKKSALPRFIGFLAYLALIGLLAGSILLNRPQVTAAAIVLLMLTGVMSILLLFDVPKKVRPVIFEIILVLVVVCFLGVSAYAVYKLLNLSSAPPLSVLPVAHPNSVPSGHVVLMEGWSNYERSGFNFKTARICAWNDAHADILVAAGDHNRPKDFPARFMIPYNKEPYRDPGEAAGEAGALKMPFARLDDVNECPIEGYSYHWVDPLQGDIFCLRTRDGQHYAKLKVEEVQPDQISFDWVYQPNGGRTFR